MRSEDRTKTGSHIGRYIATVLRRHRFVGDEYAAMLEEIKWTLGQKEKAHSGILHRMESTLSRRDDFAGSKVEWKKFLSKCPEIVALRECIEATIGDETDCRPIGSATKDRLARRFIALARADDPLEAIDQAEAETFIAIYVKKILMNLDKSDRAILSAKFNHAETTGRIAAKKVGLSHTTYMRRFNQIIKRLSLEIDESIGDIL
jgi:hypothetical protein